MATTPRIRILIVIAAVLAASACRDAPSEPLALVVAAETEAALRVAAELPALPQIVERARATGRLEPEDAEAVGSAYRVWQEAESTRDPAAATELRYRSYALAAPVLVRSLGPAGLAEIEAGLRRWIELASTASDGISLPGLAGALDAGRALLARAAATEHPVQAAALLLEAADRLRETTPDAVARRMIRQVEEAMAAERGRADGEQSAARRRAERLLRGAREALAEGDPVLAIRRAYYARQLLGH